MKIRCFRRPHNTKRQNNKKIQENRENLENREKRPFLLIMTVYNTKIGLKYGRKTILRFYKLVTFLLYGGPGVNVIELFYCIFLRIFVK